MFKIAIFEDEPIILHSLCDKIDWAAYGCTVVGRCSCGEQCADVVISTLPDLVITDIQMNTVNGLDLCDWLQESYPDIQKIVITGYGSMEYAKRAFKSHVIDFVLKPIDRSELIGSVKKAILKLNEQKCIAQNLEVLSSTLNRYKPQLIEKFLSELADGRQCDVEALCSRAAELGMSLSGYFCLAIETQDHDTTDTSYHISTVLQSELDFGTLLDDYTVLYFCLFRHRYYCICDVGNSLDTSNMQDIYSTIHNNIVALQNRFVSVFHLSLYMCCSDIFWYPHEFYACFEQVNALFQRKFFVNGNKIVHNNTYVPTTQSATQESLTPFFLSVITHTVNGNHSGVTESLDILWQRMQCLSSEEVKFKSVEFFVILKNHLSLYHIHIDTLIATDRLMEVFSKSYSFADIQQILENVLDLCINERVQKMQHTGCISQRVITYIHCHLGEELMLKNIADNFNYNPKYLSMLIKKETGQNITDIILDMRIDKSKELLASSELKTYDVAAQVGFTDARYFSQLFRKQTGLTPKAYRRLSKV